MILVNKEVEHLVLTN